MLEGLFAGQLETSFLIFLTLGFIVVKHNNIHKEITVLIFLTLASIQQSKCQLYLGYVWVRLIRNRGHCMKLATE